MEIITGIIYCLKSNKTDKIYIGSTTQKLNDRFTNHKSDYKNKKDVYHNSAFELLKYNDCYCEVIKEVVCTKHKLLELEGEEIKKNKKSVNKLIAGSMVKYTDFKEYKRQYDKEYQEKNKEYRTEYYKKKEQCECGIEYSLNNKARHKKSIQHKEYLSNNII